MRKLTSSERRARDKLRAQAGRRLKAARQVLGYSQAEFAQKAGIASNAYNQIEAGHVLPSIETAIALRNTHGLTLDYMYCGDAGDLSAPLRRALEAMDALRSGPKDES